MKYIPAVTEMANDIYHVFYTTIRTVYPKYYPKEAVDFFIQLHNKEQIRKRIASEHIGVLTDGRTIVGTGCLKGSHITGVYVLPDYQKQHGGSQIMDYLEHKIAEKHDKAILDASLPAVCFYGHRGYQTVGHGVCELENDVKLVYEIMEKQLIG